MRTTTTRRAFIIHLHKLNDVCSCRCGTHHPHCGRFHRLVATLSPQQRSCIPRYTHIETTGSSIMCMYIWSLRFWYMYARPAYRNCVNQVKVKLANATALLALLHTSRNQNSRALRAKLMSVWMGSWNTIFIVCSVVVFPNAVVCW